MDRYLRIAGLALALTPLAFPCGRLLEAADADGKSPNAVRYHGGDEIILQGFHWNSVRMSPNGWYARLAALAPSIAADGFTTIWMPVPWRDFSSWHNGSASGGGEGYFWHDFNKNGRYGSDGQLKQAANALQDARVKVLYDVVPNHMNRGFADQEINLPAGQGLWRDDCVDPGNGANDCDDGDRFMGGDADLNTGHGQNFERFAEEFRNLKDHYQGGGLRFDFARGYAAERVDRWMGAALDNGLCIGELWKSPGEYPSGDWRHGASWQQALKDWSDRARCSVFDFALKERMQNGGLADWRHGLNGNPDPRWREVAVTFVDNHDTGYSPGPDGGQHHWPLPDARVRQAYAYILASPGTPVVYWSHLYDWGHGALIRQLIQIRRAAGVRADSPIQFHDGYSGLVASVTGTRQTLLLALGSDLGSPAQVADGSFTALLAEDDGQLRVWARGAGDDGGLVSLRLRCDNGVTQPGDSVYAVGNLAALGAWNPAGALRLSDTRAYPTWQGRIDLPAARLLEWKCIVRSEAHPGQVRRWQTGPNNRVLSVAGVESRGGF